MIAIINYGSGNLGSIQNMLKLIGEQSIITSDADELRKADKLILPGVGSFDAGVKNLEDSGLKCLIIELATKEKKPVLGICLGMQLLGRKSEEGKLNGLGLIPFDNVKFDIDETLKVPHMGWNIVRFEQDNPLLKGIEGTQRYYFVHSFHAVCDSPENELMSCDYGERFVAAVCKDNIYGVQFHPEKSHDFGLKLLKNFVEGC